jgi:hypothetical protein
MANDQHVAIIKKGMEAWNACRHENRDVLPDLSSADLSGVDLSGANLSGAILGWADLGEANLPPQIEAFRLLKCETVSAAGG